MARLMINGDKTIDGKLTVTRTLVEDENGTQRIVVQGALQTEAYIEEIDSIDCPRFTVVGVNVMQESFGSEEKDIVYTFTADSIVIEEE